MIHILYTVSASFCNPFSSAAVNNGMIPTLLPGHGIDDGFHLNKLMIIHLKIFELLAFTDTRESF